MSAHPIAPINARKSSIRDQRAPDQDGGLPRYEASKDLRFCTVSTLLGPVTLRQKPYVKFDQFNEPNEVFSKNFS
jgi:hypothetical protein